MRLYFVYMLLCASSVFSSPIFRSNLLSSEESFNVDASLTNSEKVLKPQDTALFQTNDTFRLEGDYIQVYSNYFIQSSSEIDWKCVTIHFTMPSGNVYINSTKTAFLHGRNDEIVSVKKNFRIDQINDQVYLRSKTESLIVRDAFVERKPNYFVLTGVNNITLYVIAQNVTDFMANHNDDVVNSLKNWDFVGAYKSLRPSYDETCLRM